MQKVNFGARLLTPPEKFILKTDAPEEAAHLIEHINKFKKLIESSKYDSKSAGDTVELVRANSKNKFAYEVIYRRANNGGITQIHMENVLGAKKFHWYNLFKQVTNIVALHNNVFPERLFFRFEDVLKKLFSA